MDLLAEVRALSMTMGPPPPPLFPAQCVVIVLLSFSCPILFKHTLSILCEKNINGYLVSSIHRKSAKVTVSSFGLFWCEPARVAFTSVCVAQLDFNVKFDKHPAAFS